MTQVSISRAGFLIHSIRHFRAIGTPVERELRRAKLPTLIEEMPDAWVSTPLFMRFRQACVRIEALDDAGWSIYGDYRIERRSSGSHLQPVLDRARTLFEALNAVINAVGCENNFIKPRLQVGREWCTFSYNDPYGYRSGEDVCPSEWHRIMAAISMVRQFAGPAWAPTEISFLSHCRVPDAARERFPNTRFLVGRCCTAIRFPSETLALGRTPDDQVPAHPVLAAENEPALDPGAIERRSLPVALRHMLEPYLSAGRPSADLAAEMAAMGRRSLQRALRDSGTSFVRLLEEARFTVARRMLADPDIKMTEIAMATGFDEPGNFSRAFRKIAGMSPRQYRHLLMEGRIALLPGTTVQGGTAAKTPVRRSA